MTEPESRDALSRERVLTYLRDHATELDPAHAHLFRSMGAGRWMDAAELAAELLVEHWHYRFERRWRGRREHSAAVNALLERTNEAQLIAALAWVHMAIWLLPDPTENQ